MQSNQSPRFSTPTGRSLRALVPPAGPSTWLTLAVGAVIGLALGLFIGWQVMPVQWTAAWPGDLSREARAQYLAAVAEAYTYYGDDAALELARNRLFDLNENLDAHIADAIDFFSATRPSNYNAAISNLGLLAQRLNETAPAVAPPGAGGVGDTVRAWVNWTLTALAAIVLAGGGIYIVNRMQQQRVSHDHLAMEPGGFDDEEDAPRTPRTPVVRNPFMRPGPAAQSTPPRPVTFEPAQGEDYGFDEEEAAAEDAYRPSRPIATSTDYALRDEAFDEDASYSEEDFDDDAFTDPAPYSGDDFAEDDYGREDRPRASAPDDDFDAEDGPLPATPFAQDVAYVDEDADFARASARLTAVDPFAEEEEDNPFIEETPPAPVAPVAPASSPSTRRGKAKAAKTATVLQTYTVTYQTGATDVNKSYNQAFNITDPASGRTIGECGMMVNAINGMLDNDPDAVTAMDVWLVDKKQETSFHSQDRVLLSEYAFDRGLEAKITRERPNDPSPIIPQGGRTTFDIRGPHLILQCSVVEAVYVKQGPRQGVFERLTIEMTVIDRDA